MKAVETTDGIKIINGKANYKRVVGESRYLYFVDTNKETKEQLKAKGVFDIIDPIYNPLIQSLGDLSFNGTAFEYVIIDKTFSETIQELKINKIAELKRLFNAKLNELQWYWDRAVRTNGTKPVPQSIVDQDTALRTQCDSIEAEINSLNKKVDVVKFELPIFS